MLRLCVAGSGGVGKSSLTIRYLRDEFTEVCLKTYVANYNLGCVYIEAIYLEQCCNDQVCHYPV